MAGRTITIRLGNKDRHLRYDLNALAEIEDKLDTPIAGIADIAVSVKTIRTLVWAGLMHEEATLTERDVGGWIGAGGASVSAVMEKVGEALADAFGGVEDANPTTLEPPAVGIGRGSDAPH